MFRVFFLHLLLVVCAGIFLLPFCWLLCAAFKRTDDLFAYAFLPWDHLGRLTLDNFRALFEKQPFGRWLINSVFLASTATVASVALSSLGGFALAKYRFAGRRFVTAGMLGTLLLPAQVLLPGEYELMVHLGWVDSYAAILLPGAVSIFGVFLFRQAMLGVPDDLLSAGRIDGASELRLWWEIVMPAVRPMTGAFTLLSFLAAWGSYLWPQIILQDEAKYPLPVGLANLAGLAEYQSNYGILMAATLLGLLPVAILFFALQRDFVGGLTSGAVKG